MSSIVDFTIINIGTLSMNKYWGETERLRQPTATCTLLQNRKMNLLVDPSPYPQELEGLLFANAGLRPENINFVFVTHFHGDHHFGLELFKGAKWLMAQSGLEEWSKVDHDRQAILAEFSAAESNLPDGIELFHAPGHTFGLHALSVNTRWGCLIVAGDAVMTKDYFENEEGYRNSEDFNMASQTIRSIKNKAGLVIPGHGNLILNFTR